MSTAPHRVLVAFVSATLLIAGGCRRAQSTAPQPSVAEPTIPHFAGVDIVPTASSGFLVRIRGGMVGNGEPLYVIDGAPTRIQRNRGIDWFPPEAIADIKVLKSPHELAEYGPSGANGVVVITTKRSPQHPR
jgi:TonB-dependent SusC/RagA subfamily outer membrane receptor